MLFIKTVLDKEEPIKGYLQWGSQYDESSLYAHMKIK
jgi:hypothetical protein